MKYANGCTIITPITATTSWLAMPAPEDGESQKFLENVLDAIEQREARLLVWGLVDGRLSRDEIEAVIDPLLDEALEKGLIAFMQASEVVAALRDRRLLFETDTVPYPGYRSGIAGVASQLCKL